jgi:hypothetical protein
MWPRAHACALLALLALACTSEESNQPPSPEGAPSARALPEFDGERAFSDLRAQVALGSRPAGSVASAQAREQIASALRQAGLRVEVRPFQVTAPDGRQIEMSNLIGVRPGRTDARILLAAHYDTKHIEGIDLLGANDGASGVALLLELARTLGSEPGEAELAFLFLDGEEAFGPQITSSDGLYGSRALAAQLSEQGELERVHAFLLVDMVGDRELSLAIDRNSSRRLFALAAQVARELGKPDLFDPRQTLSLVDDHLPFRERGVREVLALIDFAYGGPFMPGPLWHTAGDTLEAVSAQSLNTVGRLVVAVLARLEGELVAARSALGGTGRDGDHGSGAPGAEPPSRR